ncbi:MULTISPECIES: cobalamin B12-binding domain-containing protein [Streptomyces]|uniref:Cobalamin B12-binding domain-containing protein n=1 Tax=Streptomyces sudanensis TaxID=436397 RepID=A0ABY4THK3_9ACTN|nr:MULTISPECIES: cobalamin-dependent protein [Streptomyces]URN18232.1 cobalamin B12-binding domain-containing protein [Streptomyces sudanensis]
MTVPTPCRDRAPVARKTVLVSSVSSDSHTWNLVYLQLLLEEMGHDVVNIGACVPDRLFVDECLRHRPDLAVVSTVNGHGYADGRRLIRRVREETALDRLPVVIGGKLGIRGGLPQDAGLELIGEGFSAVFDDSASPDDFRRYVESVSTRRLPAGSRHR